MRKITSIVFLISTIIFSSAVCFAQNDSTLSVEQLKMYSNQSKQLISYLQGTLNFIGNPNELPSDKDIIFNNSYSKIFKNAKVQVEDDLDEHRDIPLNKNIQAYLKDIDFFYKTATFNLEIENIEQLVSDSGVVVFKITLNRHLQGVTVNNDTVDNHQLRFIEINVDPIQRDLKIASIYTTKICEKEELKNWWNTMNSDWKNFFGKSVIVYDTVPFKNIIWFSDSLIVVKKWDNIAEIDTLKLDTADTTFVINDSVSANYDSVNYTLINDTILVNTSIIYNILKTLKNIRHIDISNNHILNDITPISELTHLTTLNISNTLVTNLMPIRNLNKLEIINCAFTPITSITSLRYLTSLTELNCSNTQIESVNTLANLRKIRNLNLSYTSVSQADELVMLSNLVHLNISGTNIIDLSPLNKLSLLSDLNLSNTNLQNLLLIDSLTNIKHLNIDSTNISDLTPLSNYKDLSILQANNTAISSLEPLNNHTQLKVIYCDNSKITLAAASKYIEQNPNCLVIFNSQELINWWNKLSDEWQNIFFKNYGISQPITKEKLHQLINQTSLSVANNKNLQTLTPVSMLHRLEFIDLQNTDIDDVTPLSGLTNLKEINIDNTKITSIEPLVLLSNIKTISFNNTNIDNITPLKNANNIKTIYCDKSLITTEKVVEFNSFRPECLIVYQSEKLRMWWNNLDSTWQQVLASKLDLPEQPSGSSLQQLVQLKSLNISNNMLISNLNPLHIFTDLQQLTVNSTSITDISPITSLGNITKLNISSNPISDLELINKLSNLTELTLENTSVEDLEPLINLQLSILNISGTRVKSLKYIQNITSLKKLYINNTRIRSIKQLYQLTNLQLLQCYNTSIKASKIKQFTDINTNVEVVYY